MDHSLHSSIDHIDCLIEPDASIDRLVTEDVATAHSSIDCNRYSKCEESSDCLHRETCNQTIRQANHRSINRSIDYIGTHLFLFGCFAFSLHSVLLLVESNIHSIDQSCTEKSTKQSSCQPINQSLMFNIVYLLGTSLFTIGAACLALHANLKRMSDRSEDKSSNRQASYPRVHTADVDASIIPTVTHLLEQSVSLSTNAASIDSERQV